MGNEENNVIGEVGVMGQEISKEPVEGCVELKVVHADGEVTVHKMPLDGNTTHLTSSDDKGNLTHISLSADKEWEISAMQYQFKQAYGDGLFKMVETINELNKSQSKKVQYFLRNISKNLLSAVNEQIRCEYRNLSEEEKAVTPLDKDVQDSEEA